MGLGEKLIGLGEGLLAWFDYRGAITSSSSEAARPYIGPDLMKCVATIPTVYRCVMRKATDKSRVPLLIGRMSKSGERTPMDPTIEGSPARLFRSVNDTEGPASFRARLDACFQLTGDGMVELEYLGTSRPREMWLMQPNKTTIIKGARRKPLRYEYSPDGQPERRILMPEQVFHTRMVNPADDWRGLTWLRSTQIFAWLEDQIAKYNTEFLAHGGVPPGWISFDDHVDQLERPDLKKEIQEITSGRGNRKRVGVLWDGAKWVPSGISPAEGEFIELLETSKEQIASAAGVPPMYVGDLREASYANASEQKEMYWFNTIIPELEMLAQDITENVLWRLWGDENLVAWFDYEKVEAIQDLRLKRAQSLVALVSGGLLTQNEARIEIGKPRATGGDTLYAPQILAPTGTVSQPLPPARAGRAQPKAWIDDPVRHEKRMERERDMESFVPEIERLFVDLATRQEKRLVASLEKAGTTRTKDSFDVELPDEEFEAVLLQAYARIVHERGQSAMAEVVDDPDFLASVPGVTSWMERTAARESKLIGESARQQVSDLFARANDEGLTTTEIASDLVALFDLRRSEALRIAWTETGTAYNAATDFGWRQSEVVTGEEWISSRDSFVRSIDAGDEFDHAAMDGVQIGLDEEFVVPGKKGDEAIPYPGEGSAGNRINCRCTILPVVDQAAKRARESRSKSTEIVLSGDFDALFAEPSAA
jgi:HK97 family phage portal protein